MEPLLGHNVNGNSTHTTLSPRCRSVRAITAGVSGSVWGLFLYACCEGLAWAGGSDSPCQILRGRFREQLQAVREQGEDRHPVSALCLEARSFSSPCVHLVPPYSILLQLVMSSLWPTFI